MKSIYTFILLFIGFQSLQAQMVTMSPAVALPTDEVTIIFDASQGNGQLIGAETVYMFQKAPTSAECLQYSEVPMEPLKAQWQQEIILGAL